MSGGLCPNCFSGFNSDGVPTGKITTVHGLRVYIAEPEGGIKPKGLIVIIHDAFGMDFVNNQILADRYAKRGGFLVYITDLMDSKYSSQQYSSNFNHNSTNKLLHLRPPPLTRSAASNG